MVNWRRRGGDPTPSLGYSENLWGQWKISRVIAKRRCGVIPYGYHWLEEADSQKVAEALRSEWITQGPLVKEFERALAQRCGARYGVAFSSGTAALHAACFAAGISQGDEVITTPLTFVATANAVLYQGGTPVFADIDPETLNIDPNEILRRITPRTKGILPVHFGGLACSLGRIHRIAREKGLIVIEDACHALGAEWLTPEGRWERIGACAHSDMAAFSFHPAKLMTTGEGGMVLTNNKKFYEKLMVFRHHGIVRPSQASEEDPPEPWGYQMRFLGFNYRITDFQCALGLSQLERLDRFLSRRRQIAKLYSEAFGDLGLVGQPDREELGFRHAWHLYVVRLPLDRLQVPRATLFRALRQAGVGVNVHYLPVHLHPYYQQRFSSSAGDYPQAERYYAQALTLPLYPKMTDEEVATVVKTVRDLLQRYRVPKPMETVLTAPS